MFVIWWYCALTIRLESVNIGANSVSTSSLGVTIKFSASALSTGAAGRNMSLNWRAAKFEASSISCEVLMPSSTIETLRTWVCDCWCSASLLLSIFRGNLTGIGCSNIWAPRLLFRAAGSWFDWKDSRVSLNMFMSFLMSCVSCELLTSILFCLCAAISPRCLIFFWASSLCYLLFWLY